MSRLAGQIQELRAQLADNARLRLALWAVFAILWIYALLVAMDQLPAERAAVESQRAELARLRSIESEAVWQGRLRDAQQLTAAAEALTWTELKPGLAQAEVQDWLRQVASKAGLSVRDVRLASDDNAATGTTRGAMADSRDLVRLRLQLEFNPLSLVAFLNELGVAERGVSVERMQLKAWAKPPQAELDIRVRLRKAAASS